jgi:cytidine deaminase
VKKLVIPLTVEAGNDEAQRVATELIHAEAALTDAAKSAAAGSSEAEGIARGLELVQGAIRRADPAQTGIDADVLAQLRAKAQEASTRCYVPYSQFPVLAAVKAAGKYYSGANVEIANYSLTKHAEESAIMAAICGGAPLHQPEWLEAVYVCGGTPCGGCRQFIREFGSLNTTRVVVDRPMGTPIWWGTLGELLVESFGPDDLEIEAGDGRPGAVKLIRERQPVGEPPPAQGGI